MGETIGNIRENILEVRSMILSFKMKVPFRWCPSCFVGNFVCLVVAKEKGLVKDTRGQVFGEGR